MLAVVLESGDPRRLYTGLSLLASSAAEGEAVRALASFGALPVLLAEDISVHATVHGEDFARALAELRATIDELADCRVWACAAAVDAIGASAESVAARLEGVMSTPRFLRETAGARLVVV